MAFNIFNQNSKGSNKITVGNKTISVPNGANVSVNNNKVYINGKLVDDINNTQEVAFKIEGKANVTFNESVNINGNITGDVSVSGSLNCDNISGNVDVRGSINCDDVGGNIKASGSVRCDDVYGKLL